MATDVAAHAWLKQVGYTRKPKTSLQSCRPVAAAWNWVDWTLAEFSIGFARGFLFFKRESPPQTKTEFEINRIEKKNVYNSSTTSSSISPRKPFFFFMFTHFERMSAARWHCRQQRPVGSAIFRNQPASNKDSAENNHHTIRNNKTCDNHCEFRTTTNNHCHFEPRASGEDFVFGPIRCFLTLE